jgi:hypothetical protein
MVVFLGVHFINETTTDAQSRRKVRRIAIHEKYDPDTVSVYSNYYELTLIAGILMEIFRECFRTTTTSPS